MRHSVGGYGQGTLPEGLMFAPRLRYLDLGYNRIRSLFTTV